MGGGVAIGMRESRIEEERKDERKVIGNPITKIFTFPERKNMVGKSDNIC